MTILSPNDFAARANVSRETLKRLGILVEHLIKWQAHHNLVSKDSLSDVWRRHILDSAQLFPLMTEAGPVIDLGSGAGFPGIVLAIMGHPDITLIESNGKKCSFMREVARLTDCNVTLIADRIEAYSPPSPARYITARALSSLNNLLAYSHPLLVPSGTCLFLKGNTADEELTLCRKSWTMQVIKHHSQSNSDGIILEIGGIDPIHDAN